MGKSEQAAVCDHVYARHPAMRGAKPSKKREGARTVYTFSKRMATSPGGPKIQQTVRATVDENGRVVKLVASR